MFEIERFAEVHVGVDKTLRSATPSLSLIHLVLVCIDLATMGNTITRRLPWTDGCLRGLKSKTPTDLVFHIQRTPPKAAFFWKKEYDCNEYDE